MAESKSDYEVSPADHATHPLQEGVVRRTGGRPRPSASQGADAISRNSYFRPTSSAAHGRAAPATDRCRSAKSDPPQRAL
jgi:hypothetical protein